MLIARAIIISLLVIRGWSPAEASPRTYEFRYRLDVEVETPSGVKFGDTVVEITYSWPFLDNLLGFAEKQYRITGESVFILLKDNRPLIVLLTGSGSKSKEAKDLIRLPIAVYGFSMRREKMSGDMSRAKQMGKKEIPIALLPTMVTFGDIADRHSIMLVDPNDLSVTFGPGYSLRRATIEPTDAPLTNTLDTKLPWLGNLGPDGYLSHEFSERAANPLMNLQSYQFKANVGSLP
ncbi:MAG: hypothetical protein E5Y31_15555 [Mesorhizobium sp.]|nr:MAG: hypothetical protein E5Y31_15555 [Mesorhizobium sp.]